MRKWTNRSNIRINFFVLIAFFSVSVFANPLYDLEYAEKALANAQPDKALLAFERVLMYDPVSYEAKLGLGSSLYQLNLLHESQQTLQELIKSNPPLTFSSKASEILERIEEALPKKFINRIYYSINGGYDSNATVATEANFMQILSLQGMNLDIQHLAYNPGDWTLPSDQDPVEWQSAWHDYLLVLNDIDRLYQMGELQSQAIFLDSLRNYDGGKIGSFYGVLQVGDRGGYTHNEKLNWFWDINLNYKGYSTAPDYNNSQANIVGGMSYNFTPKYSADASIYYQEYILDDERYQETPTVTIGFKKVINANNSIKIFTSEGMATYLEDSSSNLNMYQGGIQWMNTDLLQNHILISQIVFGKNQSRDKNTPYNSSNFYGFNFDNIYRLTTKTNLDLGLTYQHLMYKEMQFFDADREVDEYLKIDATLSYFFVPNLSWNFSVAFTNNFSNFFMKNYNRYEVETGISYDF